MSDESTFILSLLLQPCHPFFKFPPSFLEKSLPTWANDVKKNGNAHPIPPMEQFILSIASEIDDKLPFDIEESEGEIEKYWKQARSEWSRDSCKEVKWWKGKRYLWSVIMMRSLHASSREFFFFRMNFVIRFPPGGISTTFLRKKLNFLSFTPSHQKILTNKERSQVENHFLCPLKRKLKFLD